MTGRAGDPISEADRITAEYASRSRKLPAGFYSLSKPVNLFLRQTRDREVIALLSRLGFFPLTGKRILDVGCGTGKGLLDFELWGAAREDLAGIDLFKDHVEAARMRLGAIVDEQGIRTGAADIRLGDATQLPWDRVTFDLVAQSTVFSSILDPDARRAVAEEMIRVLSPGGIILWYDFFVDNPRNPNVRGVRKAEVAQLFPKFRMKSRRVTLMPPLARHAVQFSWLLAELLSELRILNTHLLLALIPEVGA